jgi:pyridoxamine 5'-phosphate oxidase
VSKETIMSFDTRTGSTFQDGPREHTRRSRSICGRSSSIAPTVPVVTGYACGVNDDIATLREEYDAEPLDAAELGSDPMSVFARWFADSRAAQEAHRSPEANAMALATVGADATPSVRMVLLKAVDEERASFIWYTNLASRKSTEAHAAGHAALCFWWPGGEPRQVRAVGRVGDVDRAAAAAYFDSRPTDARVGAAASRQSRPIASRQALDARTASIDPTTLTLPDDWGGLQLVADELEFWQGRHGRLHDRITFLRLDGAGEPASIAAVVAAGGIEALRAAGEVVTDRHGTRWLRVRLQP